MSTRKDDTVIGPEIPRSAPYPTATTDEDGYARRCRTAFRILVGLYGLVWIGNAMFEAGSWLFGPSAAARHHLIAVFAGPTKHAPNWLKPTLTSVTHGVEAVGPHTIAMIMVAISTGLGFALLGRIAVRATAAFGFAYSFILWLVIEGLGFPYAHGQTDPGVLPVYAIAFLFVFAVSPILKPHARGDAGRLSNSSWMTARLLFALVWLFDATLKWRPAFMFHFKDQITSKIPGQPHWVAAWLHIVAHIVSVVGPTRLAVIVAIVETVIAISLLSGRGLRLILPLAMAYSLSVWCTAEAFGGPYTAQGTGVGGNVIGNVIIYMIPFLMLTTDLLARYPNTLRQFASAAELRNPFRGSSAKAEDTA